MKSKAIFKWNFQYGHTHTHSCLFYFVRFLKYDLQCFIALILIGKTVTGICFALVFFLFCSVHTYEFCIVCFVFFAMTFFSLSIDLLLVLTWFRE